MFTLQNGPLTKTQVLIQGFALYKQSFSQTWPYALLAAFFIAIFPMVLQWENPSVIALLITLYFVFWLTLSAALIIRLYSYCYQIPCNFLSSLKQALSKLIPLFLLGALYSIIVLGGTMMLVVPGIIFSISLMFAYTLLLVEKQNVLQTLITSHRLVWGHWWHTCLIITFPLVLDILFSFALFLFITTIGLGSLSVSSIFLFTLVVHAMLQAIFIPLIVSVALTLLHDLRKRYTLLIPSWPITN